MPSIEISDTDFQRLQKIAIPLVDTPKTVITKLLDSFERTNGTISDEIRRGSSAGIEEFGPNNIPPLTHTKLMAARFSGKVPEKINWDSLVRLALTSVIERCGTAQELRRLSGANVVQGSKLTDGYKFIPSHKYSYQGVSAEDAVKIVVRCAKAIGCTASIEFEWRNKDAAFRPGKRGIINLRAKS